MTGPSTPKIEERAARAGRQPQDASDAYRALCAMTRDERVAAMWRGQLSLRQLCQWSSRAQHEVPLLGGEFAWIVMRTPEWAEAGNKLAAGRVRELSRGRGPIDWRLAA
jgi:hypothetical protein